MELERLEELVARVICPRYPIAREGLDFGDGGPRLLPGGFCVFRVALPAALDDLAEARDRSGGVFPYVCSDFERGVGQQVPGAVRLPPPWAIGATGDPDLARRAGEATSLEARDRGVAVVFAPVLDVADEPRNPIVGTRAFGATPDVVSRFGVAWIEGAASGGAAAVAKHFPGHGATRLDSHLVLPTIERSLESLTLVEEPPFRAAIAAGVPGVMIGHLHVPALDDDPANPATLSRPIIHDRLRTHLGFGGVVFTDALDMGAIPDGDGRPEHEPAVRALLAGADVPLLPRDPHRAARAIRDAVRGGVLPLPRLVEAATRIEALVGPIGVCAPISRTSRPETTSLAGEIARRSVVRRADVPPVDLRGATVALTTIDDGIDGEAAAGLRDRLTRAGIRLAPPDAAADRRLVIVLADIRSSKGRVGLPDPSARRLAAVVDEDRDVELLLVGAPQAVPAPTRPSRTTMVFGSDRASLDAAVETLTGRLVPTGNLDWSG